MTKYLAKTSLITSTLVITLGLTGCHFEFNLSDHGSDLIESSQEAAEDAADYAADAAEAAADAAEDIAEAAEDLAAKNTDSWELDSETVEDFMSQLTSYSEDFSKDAENEAVKLYDDEKRLAEKSVTLIAMHSPLSIDANKFVDKARLTGSFDAWEFDANKDSTVEVPYSFYVSQGMAKVILVSPDQKVTTLIEKEGNIKDHPKTGTLKLKLIKGKSMIRIVGKNEAIYGFKMAPPEGNFPMEEESE